MTSFAVAVLVKATLVIMAALAATRLARRARAALRHVLLAAAFAVLLALPFASLVAPSISVAVPVRVTTPLASPPTDASTVVDMIDRRATRAGHSVSSAPAESRWPSWPALIGGIWMLGAALFLVPVAAGLREMRRLRRTGLPWPQGQAIVDGLTREAAIGRRVELLVHESVPGPATCGAVRPAILLPSDGQRWDEENLRRAIVHELEHVRRGDWLIQAVAFFASALYWFHPLVWIARRKLTLEAERACDDAVLHRLSTALGAGPSTALGAGAEAAEYADQLVHLAERLSASSNRHVLAMAGRHDLSARVRAVLDSRQARGRAGAAAVGFTCAAAALLAAAISPLRIVASMQTSPIDAADSRPAFEVASIKPKGPFRGPAEMGVSFLPGGRLVAVNAPIYLLIQAAYGVSGKQVELRNAETKLLDEVFDIEASAGVNALPESAPREARDQRLRQMLQSLLAERFKLTFHKQTKEVPLYALVVAPGGPRLKPSPSQRSCPEGAKCGVLSGGPASGVRGTDVGISTLAETLTTFGERHVLDRTGITGKFDIELPPWNRSSQLSVPPDNGHEPAEDPNGPSIFAVLQRQLGLRLESIRGPMDIYVVDHVERPSANATVTARKFAAVTIKPCAPESLPPGPGGRGRGAGGGNVSASPGTLRIDCMTVQSLIDRAYVFFGEPLLNESGPAREDTPRVKGGPGWIRSERFTIEAKADGAADRTTMMGPMLRAFLEERLQVQVHRDVEDIPAYALTVAKGGLKIKPLGENGCTAYDPANPQASSPPGAPPPCGRIERGMSGSTRVVDLGGMELEILMTVLKLDRHVIDRTGIPDTARFNIHFTYEDETPEDGTDPAGPGVFRALEQQLGLKLEPIKAQHGVLIVDRVVRP